MPAFWSSHSWQYCFRTSPTRAIDIWRGLDPLVTVAHSADLETLRCIAYALCNLAVGVHYRKAIVDAGGLLPIVSLACSNDSKDQLIGVLTLRAIAADPCNRRAVLEAGALKALVAAGGCFESNQMGEEEEVKNAETNNHESQSFTELAASAMEAMHCMFSLSLNELNKIQIVREGALPRLVKEVVLQERGRRGESCRMQYSLGTLANLSENEKVHVEILQAGVAQAVISTVSSRRKKNDKKIQENRRKSLTSVVVHTDDFSSDNHPWSFREAARTLANLISSSASICWLKEYDHDIMHQIWDTIAVLLSVNDFMTNQFASIAASNCACAFTEPAACSRLVELTGQAATKTPICNLEHRSSISLVDDIADMQIDESDHHSRPQPRNDDDHNCNSVRCYACLALGQIAGNDEGRRHLLSDSLGPQCLMNLCNCISTTTSDELTTFNAIFTFNHLAEEPLPEAKNAMGSLVIPAVVAFLKDNIEDHHEQQQHHHTVGYSISVLKRLCITPENAFTAISEGVLEPISTDLQVLCSKSSSSPEWDGIKSETAVKNDRPKKKLKVAIAHEVLGLLGVLSSHEGICKSAIVAAPHKMILLPLVSILQNGNEESVCMVCSIIANCAEDIGTHERLFEYCFGRIMLQLMHSRHVVIQREAGRAISNLMSSDQGNVEWQEEMGIGSTLSLANSTDGQCEYNSALILRKACANAAGRSIVCDASIGISTVLAMIGSNSLDDTCIQAAIALMELASDPGFKAKVISEGGVDKAVVLARSSVTQLRSTGLSTIRHLSLSTFAAKRALVEAGALEAMISERVDIIDEECCSEIVASLAEDVTGNNQMTLIQGRVIPFMLNLLDVATNRKKEVVANDGGGITIKTNIARAYAHISSNSKCCQRDEFEGRASVVAILNLLGSTEELIATFAATALGNLAMIDHFHHSSMLCDDGGLKTLVSLLDSQFTPCRRSATRAISRLTASPANHPIILATRGVTSCLFKLLPSVREGNNLNYPNGIVDTLDRSSLLNESKITFSVMNGVSGHPKSVEEEKVVRYATLAVGNLSGCHDEHHRYHIASSMECILSLVRIVSEGIIGIKIREYSAMALSNLSSIEENQLSIIKIGGLVSLVAGASNIPPQRIHDDFMELPLRDERQPPPTIAIQELMIPKLHKPAATPIINGEEQQQLMNEGEDEELCQSNIQLYCCTALSNMATKPFNHATLVDSGAVRAFCRNVIVGKGRIETQSVCGLALFNLSCVAQTLQTLVSVGTLSAVQTLASSSDVQCRKYAAMVLGNLTAAATTEPVYADTLRGGTALQVALKLSCDPDDTCRSHGCLVLCNMAKNNHMSVQIPVHGGMKTLLDMVHLDNTLNSLFATMALVNIMTNESNAAMGGSEALKALIRLASLPLQRQCEAATRSDNKIICQDTLQHHRQNFAGFAIANMVSNRDSLEKIINQGGVTPLFALAKSASAGAQCLAISALLRCASSPGNTVFLVMAGILDVLVTVAENDAILSKAKMEVSACICHLSLNSEMATRVANHCVPILHKLVLSQDLDTSRHAIGNHNPTEFQNDYTLCKNMALLEDSFFTLTPYTYFGVLPRRCSG